MREAKVCSGNLYNNGKDFVKIIIGRNIMVPTLKKDDILERMARARQNATGEAVLKKFRKRADTSIERRMKLKMAKMMKSQIKPKTGLENIQC